MPGAIQPTASEQSLNELVARQLQEYGEQFVPLEQMAAGRLTQLGSSTVRQSAASRAAAGGVVAFEPAVQQSIASLTSQGIDPSSGRFNATLTELGSVRGRGAGAAGVQGALSVEDRFFSEGMRALRRAGTVKRRGILGLSKAAFYENLARGQDINQEEQIRDMRDAVRQGWFNALGTAIGTGVGIARSPRYPGAENVPAVTNAPGGGVNTLPDRYGFQ